MTRLIVLTLVAAATLAAVSPAALAEIETIYELDVTVPDRAALQSLVDAGFDIGSVRGDIATVYATELERAALEAAQFSVVEVGRQPHAPKAGDGYHAYEEVASELQAQASAYPAICRLSSLGQSVQGRELWAMLITDNPDTEEDEPEFKYVSSMHGDEPVGMENCLQLVERLVSGYGVEPRITDLVDSTAIWIVPSMNPDGLTLGSRFNANGVDLNRTFPAYPADFTGTVFDGEPLGDAGLEPEIAAVMQWTAANSFTLSANLHGGALVVNYPYDDDGQGSGNDAPTPDDLLFEVVSRRYSIHNLPMWNSPSFPDGIVNGSVWYEIDGGMQDWNYRYAACNEFTIELSNVKKPPSAQLPGLWADNEESMLAYVEAVHIGVRGVITDGDTGDPIWAQVRVAGNAQPVFTDPDVGDYHRMLLPGTYTLTFSAEGYPDATETDVAVVDGLTTRVDVAMTADADGDGISDAEEGDGDFDDDTIPNYLDTDSDDDGIPDAVEWTFDPDGDSAPNYLDTDSDGDGVDDAVEGVGDPDDDGIPNYIDDDSDGDGIPDELEGDDDIDSDTVPNFLDADSDGDGMDDATEWTFDSDGDGTPDYLDTDSDGDGIPDATEGLGNPDGDALPNYLDTDSDGDGWSDDIEEYLAHTDRLDVNSFPTAPLPVSGAAALAGLAVALTACAAAALRAAARAGQSS